MIERLGSKQEARSAVAEARREGHRIGFVPTMGALHDGHLSLVKAALERTDLVVVSIFVNPTQFGPGEDFDAYPRRIDEDIAALETAGAGAVFIPTREAMYGSHHASSVHPGPLAEPWEGASRPGHFAGVATVVTKLLSIVRPDVAFFGEKDYQQLQVIKRIVEDLDLGCVVAGCPIVREPDGLALSSRNVYLDRAQREDARALSQALEDAAQALAFGQRDARELEVVMRETVGRREGRVQLDYAAIVDPETLAPLETVESTARALIAARVGATRLIDNCALKAAS